MWLTPTPATRGREEKRWCDWDPAPNSSTTCWREEKRWCDWDPAPIDHLLKRGEEMMWLGRCSKKSTTCSKKTSCWREEKRWCDWDRPPCSKNCRPRVEERRRDDETGTLLQKHRPRVEERRRDDVTGTLLQTHRPRVEERRRDDVTGTLLQNHRPGVEERRRDDVTGTLLQNHRPPVEERRRDDVTGTLLQAICTVSDTLLAAACQHFKTRQSVVDVCWPQRQHFKTRQSVVDVCWPQRWRQWSMEKQRLKFKHWDRQHKRNGTRFRTRRGRPPTDRQEHVCAGKVNVLLLSERVGVLVLWSSTFGEFRHLRRCYKVSRYATTFTFFLSHVLHANLLQAVTMLSPEWLNQVINETVRTHDGRCATGIHAQRSTSERCQSGSRTKHRTRSRTACTTRWVFSVPLGPELLPTVPVDLRQN